ncbi:MAG: BCD family MFS transporter [Cyanobacteria bacterium P01_H01_bin.15]
MTKLHDTQSAAIAKNNYTVSADLGTISRLGLFNLGLGLMSVLTLAVLNRIMIDELAIPATVTAGVLAMSQLIAPARVWFGQLSDLRPLFGLHRTSYVLLGTVLFSVAVFVALQVVWRLGDLIQLQEGWRINSETLSFVVLLGILFGLYGMALSLGSTPFTALLVDISSEDNRSKVVAIAWSILMLGIVLGGIFGSVLFKSLDGDFSFELLKSTINRVFIVVPMIVFGLALVGTWGVERKYSRFQSRSRVQDREEGMTFKRAWRILTTSRQTGLFFGFLMLMTFSLFMQEAVLEPYAGEVFGMSIAESTQLNAFWGVGILIGYSTTGFLIIPRIGKQATVKVGCVLVSLCFVVIILAGLTTTPDVLRGALILFGIATGLTVIGAISLMLDLTISTAAGTFIGAWGLAQALARAFATFGGGAILDLGKFFFTNTWLAYSLVFACQSVGMLLSILVLNQVSVAVFRQENEESTLMAMEDAL